ncbi:MAG: hypothetical protein GTN69_12385 [Armatimonadetes bacterium]|nr:hypothetical protein [Armatimonadota bacterium]
MAKQVVIDRERYNQASLPMKVWGVGIGTACVFFAWAVEGKPYRGLWWAIDMAVYRKAIIP